MSGLGESADTATILSVVMVVVALFGDGLNFPSFSKHLEARIHCDHPYHPKSE